MGNRVMNISSTFCAVVLILQVMQGSCHEVCVSLNKSGTLTCQSGALLYVERLTFIKSTTQDSNGNCVPDYNTQCGRLQTNNFTEVYLACDKTGTCLVPFHLIPIPGGCGERGSTEAFMEYTCIAATKFNDLCQEIPDASGNDDELYFSTPDYPRLSPFNTGGLCSCIIRGSKITKVRVLDLNVDGMQEGQTSNFVIEDRIHGPLYTKTSRGNTGCPLLIYNEEISLQFSTTFYINFTHGQSSSRLLVEVKGISLAFRCNIHPTTTAETTKKATTTTTVKSATISATPVSKQCATMSSTTATTTAKPATTPASAATTTESMEQFGSNQANAHDQSTIAIITSDICSSTRKDTSIIILSIISTILFVLLIIVLVTLVVLFRRGKLIYVRKPTEVQEHPYSEVQRSHSTRVQSSSHSTTQVIGLENHALSPGDVDPYSHLSGRS